VPSRYSSLPPPIGRLFRVVVGRQPASKPDDHHLKSGIAYLPYPMPAFGTFLTCLAALALLELSPAPDMMLLFAPRAAIPLFSLSSAWFVAAAVQVSMPVFSLTTLVHTYPMALNALRWTGAAYLSWLGVKGLASACPPVHEHRTKGLFRLGKRSIREWNVAARLSPLFRARLAYICARHRDRRVSKRDAMVRHVITRSGSIVIVSASI
jgi:hypothetical protein